MNVAATQPFFAGLCNIRSDPGPISLEGRIYSLLIGEIALADVLKVGNSIVQSQIEIARERALKNARRGATKGGIAYVITDAPEPST